MKDKNIDSQSESTQLSKAFKQQKT